MAESRSKVPPTFFSRFELQELINRCRMYQERWGGDLGAHLRRMQRAVQCLEECLKERGFDGPDETQLPGG